MSRAVRRLAAGLAVLLLAAGCADDGADDAAADRTTAVASPSTAAPAEPPAPATPTPTSPTAAPAPGTPGPASPQTAQPSPPDGGWWRPAARVSWQYQLSGTLDLGVDAQVYDVDWQETTAAQVAELHAAGRRVVCYVNAGAFEEWRPDAGSYPDAVLGEPLDGWPGERWLDVRRLDVLLPLIGARMDVCRDKGFDAVEADNVDGYANETGFDLTAEDQLRFDEAIAQLAHDRGLAVGLKNDVEQAADLEPHFDFAVNEECLTYDECDAYAPFAAAGKPILHVEYETPLDAASCAELADLGLSSISKDLDLGPPRQSC